MSEIRFSKVRPEFLSAGGIHPTTTEIQSGDKREWLKFDVRCFEEVDAILVKRKGSHAMAQFPDHLKQVSSAQIKEAVQRMAEMIRDENGW